MRISTAYLFQQGLRNMQSQQSALAATQNQVASGKRVSQPADDPLAAKRIIDLEQGIALGERYGENGSLARSRLQREESVMTGVATSLDRVRELALQGANSTLAEADRRALAREVEEQLGELLGLANSTDGNGEFLFAGYASHTTPFSRQPDGSFAYAGDEGSRNLQIGPTRQIATGDPGNRVFMDIRNGNGHFTTTDAAGNTGTGVIDPGSVTDLTAWDGGSYEIHFAAATPATASLTLGDGGATADTIGYQLSIDGTLVYSVDSSGTPVSTLADLAAAINDDEPTTGVEAIVDGGALYLRRTSPSADPIVVQEAMTGASDGDLDTVVGYFGTALAGATTTSASLTLDAADHFLVLDGGGTQVASGAFASGVNIGFRGIETSVTGAPGLGDTFDIAPSTDQDLFQTVQNLVAALTMGDSVTGGGTARSNAINRAIVDIDQAMERGLGIRAGIGARLAAIDQEEVAGEDFNLILKEALSETRDLDYAEAITRLTFQSTALEAAQSSFVRIQGLSLFNYLS